jgi:CMP-N-acetylneuraminic acid synthetase
MIVLIPARGQSKRIPRKNIKMLGGKPLIQWTIDAAKRLPVKDVVVSTEDEEIAEVSRGLGATVLMRPAELASDMATDLDVVNHFLSAFDTGVVAYLRPTTPFRDGAVLRKALFDDHHTFTGLRSVHLGTESAYKCFTMRDSGALGPIRYGDLDLTDMPNQACPRTYAPNGYIDLIFPRKPRNGTVFGMNVLGFVTPPTIELDTPEQWAYAEYLTKEGLV